MGARLAPSTDLGGRCGAARLGDLIRRGLTGARLEMLCVDGGAGLLAALPTAFPGIPVQRCWAHKIRNVLNKVRKPDQPAIKAQLHRIMNASTLPAAWSAARRLADRWQDLCPKAVACLRADLDDLLTCFRYATVAERKAVRTTNAIERRFREVRRRTRPMGTFQDKPPWTASCSPSSPTKTSTREAPPPSP